MLRLLATELSGPEIARTLFVTVNTLRTHTKHIFTKLDVNTRRAAVRRAVDLRLLLTAAPPAAPSAPPDITMRVTSCGDAGSPRRSLTSRTSSTTRSALDPEEST